MKTILPQALRPMQPPVKSSDAPDSPDLPPGGQGRQLQPEKAHAINMRKPNRCSASLHALAWLTRQPVFASSLPRFHVKPRWVDGTLLVHDRASDEQFQVYTPRFVSQFRAGHRAGVWYLRPAGDLESAPRSPGFPTAGDAIGAIRSGSWRPSKAPIRRAYARCRVIWS